MGLWLQRVPGAIGVSAARQFDGADDLIAYPHVPALDGAAQAAISLWIKPSASDSYDRFFVQGEYAVDGISLMHEATDTNSLWVSVHNATVGGSHRCYVTTDVMGPTVWCHLVVQYDGSEASAGDRVRIYFNGNPAGEEYPTTGPTTLGTTTAALTLGATSSAASHWGGTLAQVGVWTGVVLSLGERQALGGGASPDTIRPRALAFYDPCTGAAVNRVTGAAGAVSGAVLALGPPRLQAPSRLHRWWMPAVAAMTYDTFRPSGTLSAGTWAPYPSGTLYGVTSDEDDATYAESSTGSGTDTLDLSFPAMSTPPAGTVTFYLRHAAGSDEDDITGSGDLAAPGGTGEGTGTVT